MKKIIAALTVITSIIGLMLTTSIIYPTRQELDAKTNGLKELVCRVENHVLRLEQKLDKIFIELNKRGK